MCFINNCSKVTHEYGLKIYILKKNFNQIEFFLVIVKQMIFRLEWY